MNRELELLIPAYEAVSASRDEEAKKALQAPLMRAQRRNARPREDRERPPRLASPLFRLPSSIFPLTLCLWPLSLPPGLRFLTGSIVFGRGFGTKIIGQPSYPNAARI